MPDKSTALNIKMLITVFIISSGTDRSKQTEQPRSDNTESGSTLFAVRSAILAYQQVVRSNLDNSNADGLFTMHG